MLKQKKQTKGVINDQWPCSHYCADREKRGQDKVLYTCATAALRRCGAATNDDQ